QVRVSVPQVLPASSFVAVILVSRLRGVSFRLASFACHAPILSPRPFVSMHEKNAAGGIPKIIPGRRERRTGPDTPRRISRSLLILLDNHADRSNLRRQIDVSESLPGRL